MDEVGSGFGGEAECAQFFEVIDARYREASGVTIVITNLDRQELKSYIGERAFDRLRENGAWASFNWASMRGER